MSEMEFGDDSTQQSEFLADVIAGLNARPRSLPCKYFYDDVGMGLYEQICDSEDYYPTRTEISILEQHIEEMAKVLGPGLRVVEPGCGSGRKTRLLLGGLKDPVACVPMDICREELDRTAADLRRLFPKLLVQPACLDYTRPFALPEMPEGVERTLVYYPGSTIGNFEPDDAAAFLYLFADCVGEDGRLLIGVDLKKDEDVLRRAYDDSEGHTAAFNLNLLVRLRDELGAMVDVDGFVHRARFEDSPGRILMELVATRAQSIVVGGQRFDFAEGDAILTEHSHKPTLEEFALLADRAGYRVLQVWTDAKGWFADVLLAPKSAPVAAPFG